MKMIARPHAACATQGASCADAGEREETGCRASYTVEFGLTLVELEIRVLHNVRVRDRALRLRRVFRVGGCAFGDVEIVARVLCGHGRASGRAGTRLSGRRLRMLSRVRAAGCDVQEGHCLLVARHLPRKVVLLVLGLRLFAFHRRSRVERNGPGADGGHGARLLTHAEWRLRVVVAARVRGAQESWGRRDRCGPRKLAVRGDLFEGVARVRLAHLVDPFLDAQALAPRQHGDRVLDLVGVLVHVLVRAVELCLTHVVCGLHFRNEVARLGGVHGGALLSRERRMRAGVVVLQVGVVPACLQLAVLRARAVLAAVLVIVFAAAVGAVIFGATAAH
mmetsp:Transcript_26581/g.82165  ORF Transcript_26581/g.82165 Transcript_26581/m.82165 type:complete len:335 (-) Transcript_26581:326-1330(-)